MASAELQNTADTGPAKIYSARTQLARKVVLSSYGILLLALLPRNMWSVLPLLIFLPGLYRHDWRTHIWICFVVLVYFMVTVNHLFMATRAPLDYVELACITVLFVSAMLYARWSKQPAPETLLQQP